MKALIKLNRLLGKVLFFTSMEVRAVEKLIRKPLEYYVEVKE